MNLEVNQVQELVEAFKDVIARNPLACNATTPELLATSISLHKGLLTEALTNPPEPEPGEPIEDDVEEAKPTS